MGGWLSLIGNITDFEDRFREFHDVFSVSGVPRLKTQAFFKSEDISLIGWAWNTNDIPDLHVKYDQDKCVLISGAITEIGDLGLIAEEETWGEKIWESLNREGESLVPRLNGSFSCLIYDFRTRRATIFVDRFASRSVWIGKEQNHWIIGNYPAAIASIMHKRPKLDPAGLWSFFHAGRQVGNHGLFADIRALMAGQKAVLSPGRPAEIASWWLRRYQPEYDVAPDEWGKCLADAIKRSADRYRKVTKSTYLFLSGGLDSRIVAAAFGKPLKTLTLCTQANAETRIASLVTRALRLDHRVIFRSPYWYYDTLDASSLISSGNFLNHHAHFIVPAQDVLSRDPEAEFMLGDLMENFNKHYFSTPRHQNIDFTPESVDQVLFSRVSYTSKNRVNFGKFFNPDIRHLLEKNYLEELKVYARSVLDVSDHPGDRWDSFLRWKNVAITPTYNMITCLWPLAKERNIYFDNALNELSLKIPSELREAGLLHKWILYYLRKSLVLIPDANNLMPLFMPSYFKRTAKKVRPMLGTLRRNLGKRKESGEPLLVTSGSWLLMHEMYRKDEKYRQQIETLINDESLFPADIFDREAVRNTWEEYLAGNIKLHFDIEALRSFGALLKNTKVNGLDL